MANSTLGAYTNITGGSGILTNLVTNTNVLNVTVSFNEVINNTNNMYRFVVAMPASTNLILVGAAIKYTYTTNN